MEIKEENYITIQGWMIRRLHLSGNSLIVYAIIYGYSQDGVSHFTGSSSYLADACSCSKNCIYGILKKLVEQKLIGKIEKFTNGVKLCDYYTTNLCTLPKKVVYPTQKSCVGGTQKSVVHNTILDTSIDIYNNTKPKEKAKPQGKLARESVKDWIDRLNLSRELSEAMMGYAEMRKEMKKPISQRAFTLMINKLDKLASNESEKIEILNNSVINGWQGIFAFKNKQSQGYQPNKHDYQGTMTEEEINEYDKRF